MGGNRNENHPCSQERLPAQRQIHAGWIPYGGLVQRSPQAFGPDRWGIVRLIRASRRASNTYIPPDRIVATMGLDPDEPKSEGSMPTMLAPVTCVTHRIVSPGTQLLRLLELPVRSDSLHDSSRIRHRVRNRRHISRRIPWDRRQLSSG